jgi:chromosome segregation ATPase
LSISNQVLREENDSLRKELGNREEREREQMIKLSDANRLRAQLEQLQQQHTAQQVQLEKAQQLVEHGRDSERHSQAQVADAERQVAQLEARLDEQSTVVVNLQSDLKSVYEKHKRELTQLSERYQREDYEKLYATAVHERKMAESKLACIEQLLDEILATGSAQRDASSTISGALTSIATAQQQVRDMAAANSTERQQLEAAQQQLAVERAELEQRQEQLTQRQLEAEQQVQQYEQQTRSSIDKSLEYKAAVDTLRTQRDSAIQQLEAEIANSHSLEHRLQQSCKQSSSEAQQLRQQLRLEVALRTRTAEQLERCTEVVAFVELEAQQLRQSLEQSTNDTEALTARSTELECEIARLNARLADELQSAMAKADEQELYQRQRIETLDATVVVQSKEIEALRATRDSLDAARLQLTADLQQQSQQHADQLLALDSTRRALTDELQATNYLLEHSEAQLEYSRASAAALADQLCELETQLAESHSQLALRAADLEHASQSSHDLNTKVAALSQQLHDAHSDLERISAERDASIALSASHLLSIEQLTTRVDDLQAELQDANAQLVMSEDDLRDAKLEHQAALEDAGNAQQALQATIADLMLKAHGTAQELQHLTDTVAQQQQDIQCLSSKADELTKSLDTEKQHQADLHSQIQSLQSQLDSSTAQAEAHRLTATDLTQTVQQLQLELEHSSSCVRSKQQEVESLTLLSQDLSSKYQSQTRTLEDAQIEVTKLQLTLTDAMEQVKMVSKLQLMLHAENNAVLESRHAEERVCSIAGPLLYSTLLCAVARYFLLFVSPPPLL